MVSRRKLAVWSFGHLQLFSCEDLLVRVPEAAAHFFLTASEHLDLLKECMIDAQKQLVNQCAGDAAARMVRLELGQ